MRMLAKLTLGLTLGLLVAAVPLDAQGKGRDKDKDSEKGRGGQSRGRGGDRGDRARGDRDDNALRASQREALGARRGNDRAAARIERDAGGAVALPRVARGARDSDSDSDSERRRGRRHRFDRVVFVDDLRPSLRPLIVVDRVTQRVIAGAVSRAHLRGADDAALIIRPANDRVRLLNRSGVLLLDLDEDRARNVGRWEAIALDDRVKDGAPSFCRSGAGHPVFGRDWCIEKGFGLGASGNLRWARAPIEDVIFTRRVNTGRIPADALIGILGATAFDRLALHAITLGLLEPLSGIWLEDPTGPRVLLVDSGSLPVAEIIDRNRDDRPEVLLVTRRDW